MAKYLCWKNLSVYWCRLNIPRLLTSSRVSVVQQNIIIPVYLVLPTS